MTRHKYVRMVRVLPNKLEMLKLNENCASLSAEHTSRADLLGYLIVKVLGDHNVTASVPTKTLPHVESLYFCS